ncbi:hypothetical protein IFM89_036496 [Coptis chinensis]|uniref:Uncharacterized protein n=1 Tax=Coptis chinensis TaxID=261450 RepID=A0A835I809_9MAGN|nr:hypothetical protein IFM89_036496 [Coptis chinensis]
MDDSILIDEVGEQEEYSSEPYTACSSSVQPPEFEVEVEIVKPPCLGMCFETLEVHHRHLTTHPKFYFRILTSLKQKEEKKAKKTKASGRIKGGLEQACTKAKAKTKRRCTCCNKVGVNHDRRNCPENPNRKKGPIIDEDENDAKMIEIVWSLLKLTREKLSLLTWGK